MGHGFSYLKIYETCCQNDLSKSKSSWLSVSKVYKVSGFVQVNHLNLVASSFQTHRDEGGGMAAMKVLLTNLL